MRYVTAGESHGAALTVIVSDVPAGLSISPELIAVDLERRRSAYGRSNRQQYETDTVEFLSGIRFGKTIGSPIALLIGNARFAENASEMAAFGEVPEGYSFSSTPRPGHADLVGALKMATDDCRDVAERASARETAARVAAAGVAREFLAALGVEIFSYVSSIGDAVFEEDDFISCAPDYKPLDIEMSSVRCPDPEASERMCDAIDRARESGETLGGTFRVVATGLLPGLGGYSAGSDRLTSQLGAAVFSIPAIKGVAFGLGFEGAQRLGSEYQDRILINRTSGFTRAGNNAGGLEGGMSTGMPLVITAAMKPIPTLRNPLKTVEMETLEEAQAETMRSDICAVPAAAVVAESEVAFVLARAYLDKFGRDNMTDIKSAIKAYQQRLRTVSH